MEQTVSDAPKTAPHALRPLGSVERYFWLSDQTNPKHFCMALQVSGETTPSRWRNAIDALQSRHPLLRTKIAPDENGVPAFFECEDKIPLRVVQQEPPHHWENVISEELMEPFSIEKGPLVRAVLIYAWNYSTLILTAHHAVADGMSVAFLMKDLLEAMNGAKLPSLPLAPSQETIASGWNIDVPAPSGNGPTPGARLDRSRGRPQVSSLRLDKKLSDDLRSMARDNGTTVHGAIVAALVLAGRRLHKNWQLQPVRAISPVNLRPPLGLEDDCVVSIVFPSGAYSPTPETNLWGLARAVKDDLSEVRTREYIAGAFAVFQTIMATSPSVAEIADIELTACACEMMLSNVGVAPLPGKSGALSVEAFWGPSVFAGIEGEQMIGCATVSGCIHLLHTSFTPIPSLLSLTRATLEEACA